MNSTEPTSVRRRLLDLRVKQKQAQTVNASINRRDQAVSGRSGSDPVPLTHTQQRAWFLARLDPDSAAYNQARAYNLCGPVDVAALRESIRALITRHEILRTTYAPLGDEPMQFVQDDAVLDFEVVDLASRFALKDMDILRTTLAEAARAPFDLSRGPLVRFRIIRLEENEFVLLRVWHHITSDGWSAGVFERELSVLYNARVAGQPAQLPELPIQYADYALWQRQWLAGAVLEQQVSYWKKQLADLTTLQLPTDRTRPAMQSDRGAQVDVSIPVALADGLKALGRQEGATLFMAGLAAFKVLLYRYSGTTDIAIGTPIAGRGRTELEGLIGFFANTLVLRTDLSGAPTFRQVLARVRESALGAYTHQDLPFEKLVEELSPVRDLSRNPLFQVSFALLNMPGPGLTLQGLDVERLDLPAEHAKFDLSLDLRERNGTLQASFEYCTDLFERRTIEELAEHLGVLLGSLLDHPDQPIDTLTLMSAAERERLLVQWNDTAVSDPKEKTLAERFEAQVRRTPDATALLHEDQRLSYAQLNARANQLAHYLRERGVTADVPVAICMERSPALIVGLLGILKAGGAYVPLDPQHPSNRLAFMLTDANATVVLVHSATRDRFTRTDPRVVCVEADHLAISRCPDSDSAARCGAENLAYIIYTSGSTGTPKGVQILHRGICNHLSWISDQLQLSAVDRVLHFTSMSFDASVWEMLAPIHVGGCLFLAQPGGERDMAYIARTIHEQHLTVLQVVPSMLRALLVEAQLERCRSLRYIVCGGEPLGFDLVERLRGQLPSVRLGNFYGPTEVSIDATHLEIDAQLHGTGIVPIGHPIANVRCHVLDGTLQPVPAGVIGELYVGGVGLARGYLNQPELTAARFIADPFRPDERLYRTGDLVRHLPDGMLAFAGRNDNQVKIRGYRIEPAEIDAVLATHPDVRACHVTVRRRSTGDVGLTAYVAVEGRDGERVSSAGLRRFLSSRLPAYMIPSSFVEMESLPLTINGKVDTRALPDPAASDALERAEYVAPRDAIERTMCRVWAEMLGVERVGLDDNFFEIGGHSLLAAKLFARLDEEFGRLPALGILFMAPTVRLLARHFRDSATLADVPSRSLVPLRSEGTRPPLYFLPGVFGNVVGYVDFVRELGPDQPIYGLQSIGLDGRAEPFDSIEAMASHYLSEVRAHQPQGPYAIIGACFGATVAYEMARQLMAAGEVVAFLGAIAPSGREGDEADEREFRAPRIVKRTVALSNLVRERLRRYRSDFQGLSLAGRLSYLARKVRSLSGTVIKPYAFKSVQRELSQLEVYRANVHALGRYLRRPLEGTLIAFEIMQTAKAGLLENRSPIEWESCWQGPVKWHVLPGKNSGNMLAGRNARVLATLLTERLRCAFQHASTIRQTTAVKGHVQ